MPHFKEGREAANFDPIPGLIELCFLYGGFFSSDEEEAAAASEIAMASFLQLLLVYLLLLLFLHLSGNIFARTPTSPQISENDIIERRRRHSNAVGEEAAADPTVPPF